MQLFEDWSNAIKLGDEKYDQSVTCLADDPWNLETRSSTLRTSGTLSQTNNTYISNQARVHQIKLKIRDLTRKFNLRTPVCEKNQNWRSNENKRRKKRASFTNLDLSQILQ